MSDRWIAMHCGEETDSLIEHHPGAFLLLTQIAMRAKWKDCPITKLKAGQSFIGDWRKAGIRSEMAYRHAKTVLETCKLATFKGTNKGTVATLLTSAVYSISAGQRNGPGNIPTTDQGTGQQRTNNGPTTSNHTDTQIDGYTDTTPKPPKGDVAVVRDEQVLPTGWQKLSQTQRRQTRVHQNSPMMVRIGGWFNRGEETLWTVAETVALKTVKPSDQEIKTLEVFYLGEIDKDDDRRRTSLPTLLNNWSGEVDKARVYLADNGYEPPSDHQAARFHEIRES